MIYSNGCLEEYSKISLPEFKTLPDLQIYFETGNPITVGILKFLIYWHQIYKDAYPCQERIAQHLGVCRETVNRHMRVLEEFKLIKRLKTRHLRNKTYKLHPLFFKQKIMHVLKYTLPTLNLLLEKTVTLIDLTLNIKDYLLNSLQVKRLTNCKETSPSVIVSSRARIMPSEKEYQGMINKLYLTNPEQARKLAKQYSEKYSFNLFCPTALRE